MRRIVVLAVAVWLAAMCLAARPRRVGDASEYVAMASRLASGRPPAMTAAEMDAFTQAWSGSAEGYELQTRQLAPLRGADGRYDMPHPWVYPLIAVPGVWLVRLVGLADPWGLAAFNAALVAALFWLAVRRGAGPFTLTLLAGPLVWWIDKPISDLFIAVVVGLAALLWPHPGSIALLGLAAGQNPALGVVAATFVVAAVIADPARLRSRAWIAAISSGVLLAGLPALYYLVRVGRISPLTVWTGTMYWPPFSSLSFPLLDLNVGFVPRFTPGAVAVALAMTNRSSWRAAGSVPAAVAMAAMLAVLSQQPNHNQGGHPDFSRYWLWTWPLALPWLLAIDAVSIRATRVAGVLLLSASLVWSTLSFRQSREESYRYPTRLAAWVWATHPGWSSPAPEAFAERTSHREPGWVPTATAGCEKVLLHDAAWPSSCPPVADAPTACAGRDVLCYANARGDGRYAFDVIGKQARPDLVVHDRTWPRADGTSAWVARIVGPGRARAGEDETSLVHVRGTWNIAWRQSWSTEDGRGVVYIRDAGDHASVALRHTAAVVISVATPGGVVQELRTTPGAEPTMVALPRVPHVVVAVRPPD